MLRRSQRVKVTDHECWKESNCTFTCVTISKDVNSESSNHVASSSHEKEI